MVVERRVRCVRDVHDARIGIRALAARRRNFVEVCCGCGVFTHAVSASFTDHCIGNDWICNLDKLRELEEHAHKQPFQERFRQIKHANKQHLAAVILKETGETVDPDSVFDVHIKRIHEYKRQLLNILHVITLYHRMVSQPDEDILPRTVIFAGKAAPG